MAHNFWLARFFFFCISAFILTVRETGKAEVREWMTCSKGPWVGLEPGPLSAAVRSFFLKETEPVFHALSTVGLIPILLAAIIFPNHFLFFFYFFIGIL